jgi:hypothetical protein
MNFSSQYNKEKEVVMIICFIQSNEYKKIIRHKPELKFKAFKMDLRFFYAIFFKSHDLFNYLKIEKRNHKKKQEGEKIK